ncbi:MAG: Gfo/Idh/MocA family oxidoreductase [Verrucomicrobia bacterium]|nr:Gfo/Idh/MocA family oxidoreductase [Verrucomicrobiota bacterium]MBU1736039.1 Gfo/Idh/MocA family oxidoreductase [Verrucomicrobiota bacterium]MBU1855823.1 Gfo/Idh/MocA family oxidoreductase [Verrucomicrobiota bacterium]
MQTINVGLIGCGGFARGMHIPNLKKNPKFRIYAAMDIDQAVADQVAKDTGADYATTDLHKLLADPAIHAVFITTRHDSHAALSIQAAEAGKHILCEKPMGLNREECRAVAEAVNKAGVKYTVGYNRGMAPLVAKACGLLNTVSGKKMIYHRIQAPFPEDSWTHDPKVGGGRFVGEGCHIFDLLCELVQSPPVLVYASGGTFLDPAKVKIPDSGVITITFADGSVGTTLIASAGCAAFPKEATEIYCAGKAIYINDFREMSYFGFEAQERARLEYGIVDKGQAIEIDQLADAIINDTEPPNGLVKAARAAVISFKVNESIKNKAPVPVCEAEYKW